MKWKFILIILLLSQCTTEKKEINGFEPRINTFTKTLKSYRAPITLLGQKMIEAGLIDIATLDTSIAINLKYTTTDNFVGVDLYGDFNKCYLQPEAAEKLINAQKYLKEINKEYSLMVYDGARPKSVQQKMWDHVELPFSEKIKFLSNPKNASIHNYGSAVDVTIINKNGEELDMGAPFDYIGELAYPVAEQKLLEQGRLSQKAIDNRKLLRHVMYKAGFFNIQTEWWHFNSCTRKEAKAKYKIIE